MLGRTHTPGPSWKKNPCWDVLQKWVFQQENMDPKKKKNFFGLNIIFSYSKKSTSVQFRNSPNFLQHYYHSWDMVCTKISEYWDVPTNTCFQVCTFQVCTNLYQHCWKSQEVCKLHGNLGTFVCITVSHYWDIPINTYFEMCTLQVCANLYQHCWKSQVVY